MELVPHVTIGYTDGKVLVFDEVIKLGISGGKVIYTILGNVDGIALGIDVGTELGSLDGSFDGSNEDNLEGLMIGSHRDLLMMNPWIY